MAHVYVILNCLDGTAYVGASTVRPERRATEHFCALRAGTHRSKALLSAFKLCGEVFAYLVVDEVPERLLFKLETETIAAAPGVYNVVRDTTKAPTLDPRVRATLVATTRTQAFRAHGRRMARLLNTPARRRAASLRMRKYNLAK